MADFYGELTLLERRDLNIERNKSFFLSLFGSSSSTTTNFAKDVKQGNEHTVDVDFGGRNMLDARLCEEEMKIEDIVVSLSSHYLHRCYLIQNLAGYLNSVSQSENCCSSADLPGVFQSLLF
jgi:hypothetical protein